jgi:hypothetical protein
MDLLGNQEEGMMRAGGRPVSLRYVEVEPEETGALPEQLESIIQTRVERKAWADQEGSQGH